MKPFLCLLLAIAALAASAAPAFEDSMAQRTLACTACHGKEGRAGPDGYYPRIAGKPAGYLYNQLLNFRDGRRRYGLMASLLVVLSDDYLLEIAQHFASLDLPYPAPQRSTEPSAALQRGEALALRGDAEAGIPACAQCHGRALTGVAPNIPGLLGLPRDYLNAQMGAWRTGQRRAHAPDCMADIARQLRPEDLTAVTGWLAAQAPPSDPRPAASLPAPPTIACGSAVLPAGRPVATGGAGAARESGESSESVARGAYLARVGNCMACHTARGGVPFAGGRAIATPFGTVYAGNLTPHAATGIGRWSPDDFWQALHHGRSRDGRLLVPAFPYPNYTLVTRADADAMYDYLRSLPAVERKNTPHRLRWPYSTQAALVVWRALYFKPGPPAGAERPPSREWERGAYLVRGLGHCAACHTARNALGASSDLMDLSGGVIPMQNWYAPSLAAAGEAGVGRWPLAEIERLLATGVAAGATVLGPMAEVVLHSTQHLSVPDLRSMAVFLRSLPQNHTAAAPVSGPVVSEDVAQRGAKLYGQHCAGCHGSRGEGVAGAYPALAGNRAVTLPVTANLVQVVLHGGFPPATAGNPRPFGMPPFATVLSEADIAAVLSHIRGAWGNRAGAVTELAVSQQRGTTY